MAPGVGRLYRGVAWQTGSRASDLVDRHIDGGGASADNRPTDHSIRLTKVPPLQELPIDGYNLGRIEPDSHPLTAERETDTARLWLARGAVLRDGSTRSTRWR
jgi:hypothetical protein